MNELVAFRLSSVNASPPLSSRTIDWPGPRLEIPPPISFPTEQSTSTFVTFVVPTVPDPLVTTQASPTDCMPTVTL